MATIEKDCLLVTKAGDNLIINYPYTKAQNVDGAVLSVLGVSPDDTGNVNLTAVTELQNKTANITRNNAATVVSGVTIQNGNIYGNLVGNANTATSATKAAQDNQGNVLLTDYVRFINDIPPVNGNITLDIPSTDNFVQQSDVANAANKIPKFSAEGHLILPSGAEIW